MIIHFAKAAIGADAARRVAVCVPLARTLAAGAMERVANDNPSHDAAAAGPGERLLRAALLHFAEHGLGAALAARAQADAAAMAGDRQGFEWWLGITRTLDRRLATEVEHAARAHRRLAPE